LAIGERFDYVKFQLGLNLLPNVKTKKLATSFNYPEHSQLVIPQFRSAPEFTTREIFQKELSLYLSQILNYTDAYGSLVLFFNRQQLIETFKQLPVKLQNRVLLQTEFSSNQKLISEHKDTIDGAKPSIIFGLNSFAEGVDLPSKYCMHVIVTKLPFDTHKDPQNMVREYWVKAEKGNYFMDVSLPETCIKLIQAVGRLIRNEKDYGQVTICDNRIALKQYGAVLLNALPEFSRQYNPDFIKQAFAKIKH
jgi:ATP-dependent DNA helicase DinG